MVMVKNLKIKCFYETVDEVLYALECTFFASLPSYGER